MVKQAKFYIAYCSSYKCRLFIYFVCKQDLVLHNTSKQDVAWTLDISNTGKLFKDGTFKISVLRGILQPHEECNISISFCPSKYFFFPIVVVDISIYASHIT